MAASTEVNMRNISTPESLQFWDGKWTELDEGKVPGWQLDTHNPTLAEIDGKPFVKEGDKTVAISGRVLVPLCGATIDLKWLADFEDVTEVVGIEISQTGCEMFFKDHDLKPTLSEDGTIYKAGKITMHKIDMLLFEDQEKFDFIFDRASLIALEHCYREKYCDIMKKVLKDDGDYVLMGMLYSRDGPFPGPPRIIHDAEVKSLFEDTKLFSFIEKLGPDGPCHNFPMLKAVGKEVPNKPGVFFFNGSVPSKAVWHMRH